MEAIVGAENRIGLIAKDLVKHWEDRQEAMSTQVDYGGKAMIVCMSRRICVELYEAIRKLRPAWHHKDDDKGGIKIVMTGSASDPLDWQDHIRNKPRREELAKRFKDPKDPFKIVIVRDMWLTGFDWAVWTSGTPAQKLALLPAAQEHILQKCTKEPKPDEHKQVFLRAVTELSQAFALAVPHAKAIEIRDDVGFFQAVRAGAQTTDHEPLLREIRAVAGQGQALRDGKHRHDPNRTQTGHPGPLCLRVPRT